MTHNPSSIHPIISGGFGVYVHWPYCTRICPYCDFNVYKHKASIDRNGLSEIEALGQAIIDDLSLWRGLSGPRDITSLHFGGGTPSLMPTPILSRVIDHVRRLWGEPVEIAIEANPNDCSPDDWKDWRDAGVNRLSLGVQNLNDTVLGALGREHDGQSGLQVLETGLSIFPFVSADMIFGHVDQTLSDWESCLNRVIATGVGHMSCYQLTIEDGTAFAYAQSKGMARAVNADTSADLYELTIAQLTAAGFGHYEISNFAKQDVDRSRHNQVYWRGGDYIGVGPGAHGRLSYKGVRLASICARKPADYIAEVSKAGGEPTDPADRLSNSVSGLTELESLSPSAHGSEYVMMGLRLDEGISMRTYKAITGQDLPAGKLTDLIDMGLLNLTGDKLYVTPDGRPVLGSITQQLLVP